jgi:hypothetical protein
VGGILTIAMAVSMGGDAQAQGKSPVEQVRVVNTSAEPVPTVVQGTTTIDGAVMISGTPGVNVLNSPTVGLAAGSAVALIGTPTVLAQQSGTWNVQLGSSGEPFQASVDVETGGHATIDVPVGKLLRIQRIFGGGELSAMVPGGAPFVTVIGTPFSVFVPTLIPSAYNSRSFAFNEAVLMFTSGTVTVHLQFIFAAPPFAAARVTIAGFLVPAT